MQVIISHINLDFDGLASMVAAKKLYPKAKLILPTKQGKSVQRFLAIYRDSLQLKYPNQIDWTKVTEVILVDIASLQRLGEVAPYLDGLDVNYIVYDHHEPSDHNVKASFSIIEQVGATVTILLEEIQKKNIPITSFEATIFALGLYTDTGDFTYLSTTPRDLAAASYLLQNGANLQIVSKFSESPIQSDEQQLFNYLLQNTEEYYLDGVDIILSHHRQKDYIGGLALLARKSLETTGSDAVILVVEMGKRIFIVGRSTSDRINILPLMKQYDGGGHQKAASAMIKNGNFDQILSTVKEEIKGLVQPSQCAKDIMSSPVKVISTVTTIEDAQKMMLRYGHTGFPVVENGNLVGIISRRDIDKAKHHGLGHAPVKAYMSTKPITVHPKITLEEIQKIMINHNVGRLPVLSNEKIVGIISRTNVIEALHGESLKRSSLSERATPIELSLKERMKQFLPITMINLLKEIAEEADHLQCRAFMIGGVVRDLIIGRKNEDIDIVVEGNGIRLADALAKRIGGTVRCHEKFGTATWKLPSGQKIDITSARTEYYDYPAALPTVERSSLREDLFRRDFTINAMAIQINQGQFGKLIDFFHGYDDIQEKKIRTLYNLSFVEDPTRILRAVRFEQRFQFKMDEQTLELAHISVDKIMSTSKPRLASELQILLNEKHPVEALRRLHELGVLHHMIGQIVCNEQSLKQVEQFHHCLEMLNTIANDDNQIWICYLAILFARRDHGLTVVKQYALNNRSIKIINEIIELTNQPFICDNTSMIGDLHKQLMKHHDEAILCAAILNKVSGQTMNTIVDYLQKRKKITKLITGNDLKKLSIKAGPLYSQIMLEVEIAYLNGELASKNDAMQMIIQKYA